MWMGGCPSGFCDQPAYGERPPSRQWQNAWSGEWHREDGKYNGYIPGLACEAHGGPPPRHFGDPCMYCDTPHDEKSSGQGIIFGTKPVEILIPYIKVLTKRGELVLEPFGGSGSTLIAATKLARRCYIMEKSPQ
jgi:DNA modification methylase